MKKLLLGCAIGALATGTAFAQSTGSAAIENSGEIVVTGTRTSGVKGIVIPDVPKTRSVITQDYINRQTTGQGVLALINQIPGVNYTNTDPYGNSGGNLRIRGFPGNRIALLWDGLPLNDTGNYAIFGNQTGDSEIIERISVNLGTTDVDSPTPSAAGGVVSYQTITPSKDFGAFGDGSFGTLKYYRGFVKVETGEIWNGGPRAFASFSDTQYDKFRGPGDLHKTQYNFRVYQDLGSNGDFISLAGHYNRNRNNSYNSGTAADYATGRFFDNIPNCVRAGRGAGTVQNDTTGATTGNTTPGSCTNYYNLRINPSNTANLRGSMRLTLAEKLIFTFDPGYQYTLANGGGTNAYAENDLRLRASAASANTTGVDLNGDGDVLDTVRTYSPNNTRTNRYTALTSLIYQLNDSNRLRVAYTFDRGEHRQTGEISRIDDYGNPISVFAGKYNKDARITSLNGGIFQIRDRYSIALLNQVSGEYFGRFLEDKLTVTLGLRAPFFERKLNQYCFTQVSVNAVYCGVQPAGSIIQPATFVGTGTTTPATFYYAPFSRTIKYSPLLPSAGVSFNVTSAASIYASYGRNFSAPSTDNLYRSVTINPTGETTNAYEVGVRYRGGRLQAQVSGYWTDYKNRIVTANDADPASPTFGTSIDRNVGSARARGFDGQIAYSPVPFFTGSVFGSYTDTRIKNDVLGANGIVLVRTGNARFVETPKWQYGGRAQFDFAPFSAAAQVKYVGKRWSTDDNGRTLTLASQVTATNGQTANQLYVLNTATGTSINTTGLPVNSAGQTSGYALVDLDARVNLEQFGLAKTYFSIAVNNLFDKYYFGNISTQATLSGGPRYSIGSPRTIQGTVRFGF